MTIHEKLNEIQQKLKAPKGQFNKFGNFNYRSCEDIVEAVKPFLDKTTLTLSDEIKEAKVSSFAILMINGIEEIKEIDTILFVDSTATLSDGENSISVSGQAGININKKGMDFSQTFGSSSSYARKYALNGLFAIDDTKDADAQGKPPGMNTNAPKKQPEESADVKKRKLKKIDEIKKHILNKTKNDVESAQALLLKHAGVKSTELLRTRNFAEIVKIHNDIIKPEL